MGSVVQLVVACTALVLCMAGAWVSHRMAERKRRKLTNQQLLMFRAATVSLVIVGLGSFLLFSGMLAPPDPEQPGLVPLRTEPHHL